MHIQSSTTKSLAKFPPSLHPIISSSSVDSLHLLLEVAGARSTWLAERYLSVALDRDDASVLLVTWFYGARFWKQELRKATGMDCEELIQAGKLAIVEHDEDATTSSTSPGNPTIQKWLSTISMAAHSLPTQQDILLVLDSPDLLLGIDCFSADTLLVLIMELRALVKRTVILTSSDIFALSLDTLPPSLLQTQQQQILVSLVHQANFVLSSRTLDTGQAGDVSGVLRVTRGGRVSGPQGAQAIDKEFLYHIDTGRAAHVWQRGSDK